MGKLLPETLQNAQHATKVIWTYSLVGSLRRRQHPEGLRDIRANMTRDIVNHFSFNRLKPRRASVDTKIKLKEYVIKNFTQKDYNRVFNESEAMHSVLEAKLQSPYLRDQRQFVSGSGRYRHKRASPSYRPYG